MTDPKLRRGAVGLPPTKTTAGLVGGKKKVAKKKTKAEVPHFEMPPTEGFLDFIPAAKRHVEHLDQILTRFLKDV